MTYGFVAVTPLAVNGFPAAGVCSFTPGVGSTSGQEPPVVATSVTMRCRRDLKKEKSMRNLEFARAHRKRVVRRFNRRAAQDAAQTADNEYLSSIYGTMRFGANVEQSDSSQ